MDRQVKHTEREMRRVASSPGELMEQASAVRKQIALAAADLARIEELARLHDQLADRYPGSSGEYLRAADEARAAARLARQPNAASRQ